MTAKEKYARLLSLIMSELPEDQINKFRHVAMTMDEAVSEIVGKSEQFKDARAALSEADQKYKATPNGKNQKLVIAAEADMKAATLSTASLLYDYACRVAARKLPTRQLSNSLTTITMDLKNLPPADAMAVRQTMRLVNNLQKEAGVDRYELTYENDSYSFSVICTAKNTSHQSPSTSHQSPSTSH